MADYSCVSERPCGEGQRAAVHHRPEDRRACLTDLYQSLLMPVTTLITAAQNYSGSTDTVQFVCDTAGLQDLLSKLKDASKALERYAST